MTTRGGLSTVRRRFLGLAFLLSVVLFISLTVAIYQQAFASNVDVVLRAGAVGNQLTKDSDVKIRGVVVGRVQDIRATADGSELDLALDPSKIGPLPANLQAQLLPTTLFGPRYVALEAPQQPSLTRLASGDVINEDTSASSIELQKVLSDTMPVLQAVHPEELATTLNALDQALSGRGDELGNTLSQLNTYVSGINPSVPAFEQDMRQLVGVANTYQQAAPQLLQALRNFSTTAQTLVQQHQDLSALTTQLTATSGDLDTFLTKNEKSLIQIGPASRPTLDILAKYSPEYTCFLQQMADFVPRVRQVFGAGTNQPGIHITLQTTDSRGKYVPGQDNPEYADKRGPRCYPTPAPGTNAPQYPPDGPYKDGTRQVPAGNPATSLPLLGSGPASATSQSAPASVANSPDERDFISALLSPALGEAPADVPQWGSLLVGPLLRGTEVSYG